MPIQLITPLLLVSLVAPCTRSPASADEWVEIYSRDFEKDAVGEEPDGVFVLDGEFSVAEIDNGKVLLLPGEPVGEFGLLFGPRRQTGLEVMARIRSEASGRQQPAFGLGLNSRSGYRLLVVPAARQVQLWRGEELEAAAEYRWTSGAWVAVRLRCWSRGEALHVAGKVWPGQAPEPEEWTLETVSVDFPSAGKASVWGKPYSGKPIFFDDLRLRALEAGSDTAHRLEGNHR